MTNTRLLIALMLALLVSGAHAQDRSESGTSEMLAFLQGENRNDPAYAIYKEGYGYILKDQWREAIKKFDEIRAKHPTSEYVDDAAYWSAYAQKRLDRKKGIAAYEKFLEEFPQSRYVDDALADMRDALVIVAPGGENLQVKISPDAYAYSYGTTARASERAMREVERALRHSQYKLRRMNLRHGSIPALPPPGKTTELDPQTRIKMDALQALAESENDRESYLALKEVALDKTQPQALRIVALESLARFQRFDPLGTLLDVAKSDTSEEVQLAAIYALADLNADRGKTADALIALFRALPNRKEKQLATTLYAIAEVGNDRAVDFLATVATTHENLDLRSDAVYYLGTIGNERSRAALLKILKSK